MLRKLIIFSALIWITAGCVHPKIKYRKAGLLDPMMDPAKTGGLYSGVLSEPSSWHEKGSGEAGAALGGSCPTCKG